MKIKSRTQGIDLRNNMWKKEVLIMIFKYLKKANLPERITFLEIGAASGLVSLFFAKWAKQNKIRTKITCIEPSLSNVQFLEETAFDNNLKIDIIPLALSYEEGWVEFYNAKTKGVVGSAIHEIGLDPGEWDVGPEISVTNNVAAITFEGLRSYISNIDICYIDALLNEEMILLELLNRFPDISNYIVEFDYGLSEEIRSTFESYSYILKSQVGLNYLFSKEKN